MAPATGTPDGVGTNGAAIRRDSSGSVLRGERRDDYVRDRSTITTRPRETAAMIAILPPARSDRPERDAGDREGRATPGANVLKDGFLTPIPLVGGCHATPLTFDGSNAIRP